MEFSPLLSPDRAFRRRNIVIDSMLEDGKITAAQAETARSSPLGLHLEDPPNSVAPWFVEEVRRELERRFGTEEVHGAGLKVYTTLDLDLQNAANQAVGRGRPPIEAIRPRSTWPRCVPAVTGVPLKLPEGESDSRAGRPTRPAGRRSGGGTRLSSPRPCPPPAAR